MPIEIAGITDADLDTALANIGVLPQREQQQLLAELDELEKTQAVEKRQETFLEFIDHVYPGYKVGNHHRRLAKIFEAIANGEKGENSSHIWHRLGFWVSTRTRRLLWHLIQLTLQLTLEDVFVILWVVMLIKMFFLT
jgi:hypothetical protein